MAKLRLHPYYTLFLLYLEPLSALLGALAAFFPSQYLTLLDTSSHHATDAAIDTALTQLANLYLFFCITEFLVLRAARDNLPVWRALCTAMLIADFGHLASAWRLGARQYWCAAEWGWMEVGGIGFVYAGAATRIAFLSGLGVVVEGGGEVKKGI